MELLPVIVFICCLAMFAYVSPADAENCQENIYSSYVDKDDPNCNYTVLPLLNLTIDCSTGLLKWRESGLLPSWTKDKTDMKVYRSCTDLISNITFEDDVAIDDIQPFTSGTIEVNVTERLSCTFGTCNTFDKDKPPCWVLNEQVVSCPSPPPSQPSTNNDTMPIFTSSLCSTNCSSTQLLITAATTVSHSVALPKPTFDISNSFGSQLPLSSTSHSSPLSKRLDSAHSTATAATTMKTTSIKTDAFSSSMNQSFPLPSDASTNGSSNVSLLLIIVVSVCLTAIIIFIITSLFIMVSHKYAQDFHHHNNKSGSSDDVAPNSNFQEVASAVYIDGLLNGITSADKTSIGDSMSTICEEPIPFKILPAHNNMKMAAEMDYQTKAKSNMYVFTANAYHGRDDKECGSRNEVVMKSLESSLSCSDEESDLSYLDVFTSASSVVGTVTDDRYITESSSRSNCGRPTDIDNYMKTRN